MIGCCCRRTALGDKDLILSGPPTTMKHQVLYITVCKTWDSICCPAKHKSYCTKTTFDSCSWNQGDTMCFDFFTAHTSHLLCYLPFAYPICGWLIKICNWLGVFLQIQWSNLCEHGEVVNYDKTTRWGVFGTSFNYIYTITLWLSSSDIFI